MPLADLGDIRLFYKDQGDGPPVVGIMGFMLDHRFWAAQASTITRHHRFITFDNRGIGRSSRHVASSSEEMADDTIRLMDHLGVEKAIVFGVSMGGTIAQRLVVAHPDRVSGLILAATCARPNEFMLRRHALARLLAEQWGPQRLFEASLLFFFTPRFFEAGREVIDRIYDSVDPEGAALPAETVLGQLDVVEKHDALADLPHITCPTLVMGAKMDFMVPYFASEEIAAAIPGAELVTFESGHAFMIEEMEPFNRRVAQFLETLRQPVT